MAETVVIGERKRGATFAIDITLRNKRNELVNLDISANQVTSEIRRENGSLLAVATVAKTAALGVYKVSYTGSTASWPIEIVYTDIRAVIAGEVLKSEPTIGVSITMDQTRG